MFEQQQEERWSSDVEEALRLRTLADAEARVEHEQAEAERRTEGRLDVNPTACLG